MDHRHKCIDCGFLSARHLETCRLDEVQEDFRKTGHPPNEIRGGREIGYHTYKRYPICFVREYDLPDLFNKKNGDESKKFLAVVTEDRQCELFIAWHQGYTPKEHQEMIDREKMLKWQAEREDADRKWREKQDKKLVYIAGGFTVLGAVIGALIAFLY